MPNTIGLCTKFSQRKKKKKKNKNKQTKSVFIKSTFAGILSSFSL